MKVLFNSHVPYMLAHGGGQMKIELTKTALTQIGVETDYLQWWNDRQTCEVLHHMGALPPSLAGLAKAKGWGVANTVLLTETCNRSRPELLLRKICIRTALQGPWPRAFKAFLPWRSYHESDRMIVGLHAERQVLVNVYGVPAKSVTVVPLGLGEAFLRAGPATRTETHLICPGRITPSKSSIELARLAKQSQVPILFVGKAADDRGAYWKEFQALIDNTYTKHHPHVGSEQEMVSLLQSARGYVLMSQY